MSDHIRSREETLDGADVMDESPDPSDDEEKDVRLHADSRSRRRMVPQVPGIELRTRGERVARLR